ncbi:hypothetical protein AB3R30_18915 [Leptolyngbyaceae cyanobacterium UHCC 1019]
MPAYKPLVLVDGELAQLQSGDTLDVTVSAADEATLTNGSGSSVPIGTPVYISAASACQPSRANASGTAKVIGLVAATSVAAAATGAIRKDGTLVGTTAQWDAITGQTGGLTPGATYFLSEATAGRLTTTAPTTGWVLSIGTALSTTDFEIQIGERVRL